MYQSITLSDILYQKLQTTAHADGFESLEEFLQKLIEVWQMQRQELARRQAQVRRIDEIRTRLLTTYGEMQDSSALIRADRER
ncbi:MAG: hypothetical protein BroJett039_01880 [Chloroflexota bacterium]|nr:MAG: hypothetical protein BroJett039_01880 [Chloroflexota bacterium]